MTPPAAGSAAVVHRGRTAVPPRPRVAPRRPRRVSGPARRPARTIQRPAQTERGLVLGLLAAARNLSSSRALDRLIAGRIWIVLIAFALIGIVTLQLLVLGLNASIGRALVRDAQLQRENATLSIENSELAAGERVELQAARLGMELVPVGALRFLTADPRADIARAAAALSAPLHTATTSSSEAGTTMPPASPTSEAGATTSPTNPTGEASAPVSTQAPASPTGEAAPASAQSAPPSASAPATAAAAAGGTESTGAG